MKKEDKKNNSEELNEKSGVYLMKDRDDNIIYIGKAKNIKKRVSSYKNNKTSKVSALRKNINTIEIRNTPTEAEALMEEERLIEIHKPKFNTLLKVKKTRKSAIITKDKFPSLAIKKTNENHGDFILPKNEIELEILKKIIKENFKIRDCSNSFFKARKTPCLEFEIKMCSAPCVNKINETEYKKQSEKALNFLKKDKKTIDIIIKEAQVKMLKYSEDKNYELAKIELDKIQFLKSIEYSKSEKSKIIIINNTNGLYFVLESKFTNKERLSREVKVYKDVKDVSKFIELTKTHTVYKTIIIKGF